MRVGSFNRRVHQGTLMIWVILSAGVAVGSFWMLREADPVHHMKIYAVAGISMIAFCVSVICLLRTFMKKSSRKKTPAGIVFYAPSEERALPIRPPLHRFKR